MKLTRKSTEFCQFFCRQNPPDPKYNSSSQLQDFVVVVFVVFLGRGGGEDGYLGPPLRPSPGSATAMIVVGAKVCASLLTSVTDCVDF